jgi:galactokinase
MVCTPGESLGPMFRGKPRGIYKNTSPLHPLSFRKGGRGERLNSTLTMNTAKLLEDFFLRYGDTSIPPTLYFAPGRVNLIGEHTDYNGGFVFPCALQFGTYLYIRKNNDGMIRLASQNQPESRTIPYLGKIEKQEVRWFNYPLGVMDQFVQRGIELNGMDLLYYGDIPNSAGLSSSASIEMVTAFAINELMNAGLSLMDLTWLSKKAENEFIGLNCGIMDMFAIGMGEINHAVFLNCHTLEYKLIPLQIKGNKLVIVNSNKSRGLADSKYNERVAECQMAMVYLSQLFDISRLSEVGYPQFFKAQDSIPDEVVRRRARHVISENQRVLNAVNCLMKGDLPQFGALMNASHDSLKDNYDVTGFELDTLVEAARKIPGVLGARMTGAGFGGCTVNLVNEASVEQFIRQVGEEYHSITGLTADFYIAEVSGGVRREAMDEGR